jgi:glycosyltransferase involved in cell wall biosynthesis
MIELPVIADEQAPASKRSGRMAGIMKVLRPKRNPRGEEVTVDGFPSEAKAVFRPPVRNATHSRRSPRRPKVLVVHNFYQQAGGEDGVFADEAKLLESRGHAVIRFSVHNDQVKDRSPMALARNTVWNGNVHAQLRELARRERPDVAHFHNTFPLVSPAAYYAVREEGAAVVQTLHNFRLLCPKATFYREGGVCEECLGKSLPWPSVVHKCYRGSRSATAATAAMLGVHRAMGTWQAQVDAYVALTQFSRDKFIAGGLPADRIHVKPNFVDDSLAAATGTGCGGFAIFVGRLSPEKGVPTLLDAWRLMSREKRLPPELQIIGDGPLRHEVEEAARQIPAVRYLGHKGPEELFALLRDAKFLVFPSQWYETFGRVVIEAFAAGIPVVASNLGSMAQIIDPDRTGLLFESGDAASLTAAVRRMQSNTPDMVQMRSEARLEYEALYTAKANYEMMADVYQSAIAHRRGRESRRTDVSWQKPVVAT